MSKVPRTIGVLHGRSTPMNGATRCTRCAMSSHHFTCPNDEPADPANTNKCESRTIPQQKRREKWPRVSSRKQCCPARGGAESSLITEGEFRVQPIPESITRHLFF